MNKKDFFSYISSKINIITQNNIKDIVFFLSILDADIVYKIKDTLIREFFIDISFCIEYFDDLLIADMVLPQYAQILENYDKSLYNLILSCKIAYLVREFKTRIRNYEFEKIPKIDYIDLEDLEIIGDIFNLPKEKEISFRTIKTPLKNHQKNTLEQLTNRGSKNIVIAETGSGKTLLSIAYAEYMYHFYSIDKIIVIVERNEEIYKNELIKHLLGYYTIEKYELMTYYNMQSKLKNKNYKNTLFILDEIHLLKNKSERGVFIKNLNIEHFLGITATLVDKSSDIKNLFDNLNIETEYDTEDDLLQRYCLFMENPDKQYSLENILVEYDLPNLKQIEELAIDLDVTSLFGKISFLSRNTIQSKLFNLLNIIQQHKDEQILIFCEYIESVNVVYDYLKFIFDNIEMITGEDRKPIKNKKIESFIKGNTKILICSSVLSASYNLQMASVLIRLEQNYSVIKRIQTLGRIARIGQENHIKIYEIFPKNSIERKIYDILIQKEVVLKDITSKLSINKKDVEKDVEDKIKELFRKESQNDNV